MRQIDGGDLFYLWTGQIGFKHSEQNQLPIDSNSIITETRPGLNRHIYRVSRFYQFNVDRDHFK